MVEPWDMGKVKKIEAELDRDLSPDELISNASSFLSDITQMTCLISTPKRDKIFLRHVEFLNLNDSRILVILVLNDREVQNRVIHSEKSFTDIELNQAANFINEEFSGLSLIEVRERVLSGIQEDKDLMSKLMQDALDIASSASICLATRVRIWLLVGRVGYSISLRTPIRCERCLKVFLRKARCYTFLINVCKVRAFSFLLEKNPVTNL